MLAEVHHLYLADTDEFYPFEHLPIVRALAGESSTVDTMEMLQPDGTRIPIDVRGSPIFSDTGAAEFAMTSFADVSERKRFEVQLRVARDEALEASRAKTAFLATMSHEIRTPMNGVIGMSGLPLDSDLTPRQYEYADAVRRSGEALLTLINDILDFSKIEAGKLDIESTVVTVQEAVEDVVELLDKQAHVKGLELAVDDSATNRTIVSEQLSGERVVGDGCRGWAECLASAGGGCVRRAAVRGGGRGYAHAPLAVHPAGSLWHEPPTPAASAGHGWPHAGASNSRRAGHRLHARWCC
jgi:signal transduction histidine kinase